MLIAPSGYQTVPNNRVLAVRRSRIARGAALGGSMSSGPWKYLFPLLALVATACGGSVEASLPPFGSGGTAAAGAGGSGALTGAGSPGVGVGTGGTSAVGGAKPPVAGGATSQSACSSSSDCGGA